MPKIIRFDELFGFGMMPKDGCRGAQRTHADVCVRARTEKVAVAFQLCRARKNGVEHLSRVAANRQSTFRHLIVNKLARKISRFLSLATHRVSTPNSDAPAHTHTHTYSRSHFSPLPKCLPLTAFAFLFTLRWRHLRRGSFAFARRKPSCA